MAVTSPKFVYAHFVRCVPGFSVLFCPNMQWPPFRAVQISQRWIRASIIRCCENVKLVYILAAFSEVTGWSLLDAYDVDEDNLYRQSRTGMALPYDNWAPNEPSNPYDKCAYLHFSTTTWNDRDCRKGTPFICEYDLVWTRFTVQLLQHWLHTVTSNPHADCSTFLTFQRAFHFKTKMYTDWNNIFDRLLDKKATTVIICILYVHL